MSDKPLPLDAAIAAALRETNASYQTCVALAGILDDTLSALGLEFDWEKFYNSCGLPETE